MLRSVNQHEWVFEQTAERLQERAPGRAVDDAVVAAHGHAHALAPLLLAVDEHGLFAHGADGEDAALGRD